MPLQCWWSAWIWSTHHATVLRHQSFDQHFAMIKTLSDLLKQSNQPAWDSPTPYQQTSITLADPPPSLPKTNHTTWLHATLHYILAHIRDLETHLYNIPWLKKNFLLKVWSPLCSTYLSIHIPWWRRRVALEQLTTGPALCGSGHRFRVQVVWGPL